MTIRIESRATVRLLAVIVISLVVASTAFQVIAATSGRDTLYGLVSFFYLDAESNLPTWYSSATLLLAAALLAIIAASERESGTGARLWFGLSVLFVALSADEAGGLHENFNRLKGALGLGEVLHHAWLIPAGGLVIVLAVIYAKWFFQLPPRTRKLAFAAAGLYLGGAMAMEVLGGILSSRGQRGTPAYIAAVTVEETLEMCGVLVWIYALLDFAATRRIAPTIQFTAGAPEGVPPRGEVTPTLRASRSEAARKPAV